MSETSKSRLPVWLIVSIVVNALLIGVLIGGGLGQRKAGPRPVMPGNVQHAIARDRQRGDLGQLAHGLNSPRASSSASSWADGSARVL